MQQRFTERFAMFVAAVLVLMLASRTRAVDPAAYRHAPFSRGVLAQSHAYHRAYDGPALAYRPPSPVNGPCRYTWGFPTSTYRWGWFGAERYYPRSTSHRGYNGDRRQWAYRWGY